MPTSKARKGRMIARLKKKQRDALQRKSQLGVDKSSSLIQKTGKKSSNGLGKIIECLRFSLNDDTFASSLEKEKKRYEGNNESNCAENAEGNNSRIYSEELFDMQIRNRTTRMSEDSEFSLTFTDRNDSNLSTSMKTNRTEFNTSHGHSASSSWQSFPFSIMKALPNKVSRIISTVSII